jgi:NADPH2:quinone reductase
VPRRGDKVSFDAYDLIHPVTLTGYSSESLDGQALRHAIAALPEWLRLGAIKPPSRQLIPLAEAAKAHALLERKGVQGRILLVP